MFSRRACIPSREPIIARSIVRVPPTEAGGIGVGGMGVLTTEDEGVICGVDGMGGGLSIGFGLGHLRGA